MIDGHGPDPVTLVLVDNNRLLREGVIPHINGQSDLKVLAATGDADEAVRLVRARRPDVLLMCTASEDCDAVALTTRVRAEAPSVRIILTGYRPEAHPVIACLRAGTSGFTMHDASLDDLFATIRAVAAGEEVLPLPVMRALVAETAALSKHERSPAADDASTLTVREAEIAALLADGLSNKEISEVLHLAVQTVKTHVHHVLEKLGLRSRWEVVGRGKKQV